MPKIITIIEQYYVVYNIRILKDTFGLGVLWKTIGFFLKSKIKYSNFIQPEECS